MKLKNKDRPSLVPAPKPHASTKTIVDTIGFSLAEARRWPIPPFQRPLRVNEKVRALADMIGRDGGVIPGMLTFGVLKGSRYLLDGQHRREAFCLSGKPEGFADVRIVEFESLADMATEFVNLNSSLVRMQPDDILRGLEPSIEALQRIRKACPFVGYNSIRRADKSPVLSMTLTLRAWKMSEGETPKNAGAVINLAHEISPEETNNLIGFLTTALTAWGRDVEYQRLWSSLNLVLCMWLYRRVVLTTYSSKSIRLTLDAFRQCLMALSAETDYLEWLNGRRMGETDRAPAYTRITNLMAARLRKAGRTNIAFPRPPWALGRKGGRR